MEEFYNIFGPELKAVTGDPKRIEDVVKRVDGLVKPLENVRQHVITLGRMVGGSRSTRRDIDTSNEFSPNGGIFFLLN